jgi:CRISPR/Cas system-associated exonuclease Cas4 (RecB family)
MAYSYSSIREFKQCPRKYYENKVLKKWPFIETDATMYGKEVHKALEDYVGKGVDLGKHSRFKGLADSITRIKGEKLVEFKMSLDYSLQPCDYFHQDVYLRGIADVIVLDREKGRAYVVDYKTGGAKYPDKEQLELMALMVFRYFPEITHVKAALLFVVHDVTITAEYHKKDAKPKWVNWVAKINEIETARENDVWNEKNGPLCGWCNCEGCPHWSDKRR